MLKKKVKGRENKIIKHDKIKNLEASISISIAKALSIIIPTDEIYERYVEAHNEHEYFQNSVKTFLQFLQEMCNAGLQENDIQRLNGIINFCESFLIRNHLSDIKKNNRPRR